ncbi:MAG: hypothetical protein ACYTDY_15380 [Planctomycetota bacterium]|jgi:hypothetical protein
MKRRTILTLTAMLVALAFTSPAGVAGAGVSGFLDDLSTAMTDRRATLAEDPAAQVTVRQLDRGLRIFERPRTKKDYAGEVKAAAKLARILAGRLAEETALLALLEDARREYDIDLRAARDVLSGMLQVPAKKDRTQRKR